MEYVALTRAERLEKGSDDRMCVKMNYNPLRLSYKHIALCLQFIKLCYCTKQHQ